MTTEEIHDMLVRSRKPETFHYFTQEEYVAHVESLMERYDDVRDVVIANLAKEQRSEQPAPRAGAGG